MSLSQDLQLFMHTGLCSFNKDLTKCPRHLDMEHIYYLHFESHQVAAARSVQMASYKSSSFACFIMATAAAAVCVSKRDHFETRYYLLRCSLLVDSL